MPQSPTPPKSSLQRTAEIDVNAPIQTVFNFISDGDVLSQWLKKSGPISGVTRTEILQGPYSEIGASRRVYFENGDTLVEQLTSFNPVTGYSYSVTGITDSIRLLTSIGYGQWWFEERNGMTHVKWVYSFVPKNLLARIALGIFLSLFYTKFMKQSLKLAKSQLEK